MSIALSRTQVKGMGFLHGEQIQDRLATLGCAIVQTADLLALEEAKDRYEKFYLDTIKDHATLHPRSQRDSAPVEQSESPAPQHTEPGLEHTITIIIKTALEGISGK